jgi:hypothetical protein
METKKCVQKLLRKIFSGKSKGFIMNTLAITGATCILVRFTLTVAAFNCWNIIAVNCFNFQPLTSMQVYALSVITNISIMRYNNRKNKGMADKLTTALQNL